jgi:hypothetical protein
MAVFSDFFKIFWWELCLASHKAWRGTIAVLHGKRADCVLLAQKWRVRAGAIKRREMLVDIL